MLTTATDYFLLVFVASLGVLQLAASVGRLNGLLFFKSPLISRTLGLSLVVAAFAWFFGTGSRNLNDFQGGIDAPTQALFFFFGSFAGVGVTLLGSSLVNMRMNDGELSPDAGLDNLRKVSYLRALGDSATYWWINWRTQMKRYFFG